LLYYGPTATLSFLSPLGVAVPTVRWVYTERDRKAVCGVGLSKTK